MSKMVSIKVPRAHFKYHLVLLVSLSVVVTETRRYHGIGKAASEDLQVDPVYDIPSETENYFIEDDLPILDNGISLREQFDAISDMQENNGNFVTRPLMPPCEPRPTLVSLKAPKAGLMLQPPCLIVPRCGGCCLFSWKCIPIATETFTYSVQLAEHILNTESVIVLKRINVTEEHHKTCDCQCDVNSEVCFRRGRVYDNKNCKCVCQNELENRHDCLQYGRKWNSDSCTCDCPARTCVEGYFFNQEACKCDF